MTGSGRPLRLLFDVLHPAHVHFFRPMAERALAEGGSVLFTARQKDVTLELLRALDLPHEQLSWIGGGRLGLVRELAERSVKLARRIRRFQPDLLLGIMGPVIAPLGRLMRVPSWVFYDTESARLSNRVVYPLASRLFLPESYAGPAPESATRYAGTHELAYLHPSRFVVDRSVRAEAGLGPEEPFCLLRLVSFEAIHDVGVGGFTDPVGFALALSRRIRVIVCGERGIPEPLQHLAMRIPPERIHHLLAEARFYVGEGATMAAEAAVLGTPAVFIQRHQRLLGYMVELERYGLVLNTDDQAAAQAQVHRWLDDPEGTARQAERDRARLLTATIDVSDWLWQELRRAFP